MSRAPFFSIIRAFTSVWIRSSGIGSSAPADPVEGEGRRGDLSPEVCPPGPAAGGERGIRLRERASALTRRNSKSKIGPVRTPSKKENRSIRPTNPGSIVLRTDFHFEDVIDAGRFAFSVPFTDGDLSHDHLGSGIRNLLGEWLGQEPHFYR